ncbi:phosphate acetyltransferase [Flavisolibacter ginsengisoli]|jgi:phosphate acetyltransferase|uniref:Phosphate acetyltransferase n=1 Tax=Flavisolibacter ginsengisoli DSM 18119 TaxID=1121884 RepID=A0A1M4U0L2_9BACT|nr:phosphate acetyltransferase [Flavisolibacter ginsengisoli]SHE50239.1 phosphate acetyltransferase [Flavisolibacter ginsengisoli DSM 18119]
MTKNVFIASTEPYSGKSIVALGLLNMLLGKAQKVAYFKPIINPDLKTRRDVHIDTVLEYFKLPLQYDETFAFTRQQALKLLEKESQSEMIDTIIHKVKKLEEAHDFTIIDGSDFVGEGTAFEFEANINIAKNLGSPAIIVVSGEKKTTSDVINSVLTVLRNFEMREVQVIGVIVNKVKQDQLKDVKDLLPLQLNKEIILSVIPEDKNLSAPTMKEIYEQLGAKVVCGEDQLTNQVDNFITGAMQVPQFLNHIKENVVIVTPADRGDIVISAIQANLSMNYPKVAGIVLTVGGKLDKPVQRLVDGLSSVIPIISVKSGTFETTARLGTIHSRITADNTKKVLLAIDTFDKYVDVKSLEEKLVTYHSELLTPHMFQYQITKKAKAFRKHIVLPEGDDDRILKAAARLLNQQIVNLTILGDAHQIAASIKRLGLNFEHTRLDIVNPVESPLYNDYVQTLYELRKSKNVSLETARDLMTDVSYFGTMMVYKGHADGMVSGANHTTQHTIRPALQFVKTKPGISIVSSIFFMCLPDRVAVFGDCAVNPDPTAEELAEIAISSAESSRRFGIEPRIAMLSYSSGTSGEGSYVEKVRQATRLVKEKRPDLKVEGPIQYDAAVDPVVGKQKLPNSEVAGKANVFIFPDLNTGNNTYKAVQRETSALAIGPMLQGLNKPVNDLSRGCTVDDIFNTVIITAIQSQENSATELPGSKKPVETTVLA